MATIRTRPMTAPEFDAIRSRLISEYAAEHVAAGTWTEEEAEHRAAAQTDDLLPRGVATPGMVMLVGESPEGGVVGFVWLAVQRGGGGSGAWVYDIEVVPDRRGQGYGRLLLAAAEAEAARHGADSIGLNVFGPNHVARRLYESAGYDVTALQMRKGLSTPEE
jgi:GNAT superfamily N-acetyltransferase